MVSYSDDAADSLEQAVFLLTLTGSDDLSEDFFEPISSLVDSASRCASAHLSALENAKGIRKLSSREDMEEFLEAINVVLEAEHEADDELRSVVAALLKKSKDFRQLHALSEISGAGGGLDRLPDEVRPRAQGLRPGGDDGFVMQSSANTNSLGVFPIFYPSGQLPDVHEVGLKGQNLMRMARVGLPVPQGFVISARSCEESISTGSLSEQLVQSHPKQPGEPRELDEPRVRRPQAAPRLGSLERRHLDAGHDGHGARRRPVRFDGERDDPDDRKSQPGLGLLSPADPVVRRGDPLLRRPQVRRHRKGVSRPGSTWRGGQTWTPCR